MRRRTYRLTVVLLLICSLVLSACASGSDSRTTSDSASAAGQTEEKDTLPAKTSAAETEAPQTKATSPVTEEQTTEPATSAAPAKEAWREQYEALQPGLQQALIPSSVETDDDFLSMTAQTLEGTEWSGSEIANYEMTVIDCWETWCGPCREEMPTLQKLSAELPDNIRLMGVCFDGRSQTDTCRSIVKQCGVTYTVLLGDDVDGIPFNLANYTQGIPTLLFINAEGRCFARFVGRPLTAEIEEIDALNIIVNLALEKA